MYQPDERAAIEQIIDEHCRLLSFGEAEQIARARGLLRRSAKPHTPITPTSEADR